MASELDRFKMCGCGVGPGRTQPVLSVDHPIDWTKMSPRPDRILAEAQVGYFILIIKKIINSY